MRELHCIIATLLMSSDEWALKLVHMQIKNV